MVKRLIKLFSHNDLDGFGAPILLQTVQPTMFGDVEFDMTNCGAGRIDDEFARWMRSPEAGRFTDVYIMDMTPDSDYTFQQLNANFANHWLCLTTTRARPACGKSMPPIAWCQPIRR